MGSDQHKFGHSQQKHDARRARDLRRQQAFLRFSQSIDTQLAELVAKYAHLAAPGAEQSSGKFRAQRSR